MTQRKILVVITFLLFISMIPFSADGADPLDPEIEVILDSDQFKANVSPDDLGVVECSGMVKCDLPLSAAPNEMCVIYLETTCEDWIAHAGIPLHFSHDVNEKELNIIVQPPMGESSETIGDLVIEGHWEYTVGTRDGELEPIHCNITIKPYVIIELTWGVRFAKVDIGEWADFQINVENHGNHDSNITLLAEPHSDKVEIDPSVVNLVVPAGGSIPQPFQGKVREGKPGEYPITLSATSDIGGEDEPVELNMEIWVPETISHLISSNIIPIALTCSVILLLMIVLVMIFKKKWKKNQ